MQEQSFKGEAQPRNRVLFAHRHEQVHGGRVWQPGLGRTTHVILGDGRCEALRKDDETYALQKKEIEVAGKRPIFSYNQTDFVKERIAVEVQFGKYSVVAYDLFVKHMAFYIGNVIDVGVEILAMKSLQEEMASGVGYYEGELYNLIREGRGVPAVPLVLIGVAP